MSDQKDDTNPNIPRFTGAQAYQRIKELTSQLDANPDDPAAKDEFNRLMKYIGANPKIAAEFTRLRTSDVEIAAEFAQLGEDYEELQSPTSAPSKPEKKYVTTASLDFGKVREKATQGLAGYPTNSAAQPVKPEEKPAVNNSTNSAVSSIAWNWTGEVIDFWSDLIEGHGEQQDAFVLAYRNIIQNRGIDGVSSRPTTILAGHFELRKQYFEVFRWRVAKAAFRTQKMGNDLYISWRVFVAEPLSIVRLFIWLVGCALWGTFTATGFNFTYNPYRTDVFGAIVSATIPAVILTGILLIAYGLYLKRDILGMFRRPLDEFDRDDAMAAAHIIHKSLLQAADTIGIDSMTLAPRRSEPSDRPRASRRI